jgi:hypothetical protein
MQLSGFRRHVNEFFALLGCYAGLIGIYLPMFRDKVSVPFSRINQFKKVLEGDMDLS